MTLLAGLREPRSDVVRIGCSLVVLQVAAHTGRAGDVEVVINVTVGANPRRHGVAPSQRESNRGMIEVRAQPRVRTMAEITGRRKSRGHVVGIRSGLEIV